MNHNYTDEQKKEIFKNFRAQTGYSLGDCKKTLEETGYDMNKARDILAKKYAAKYSMGAESGDMETPEYVTKVFHTENGDYGYLAFRAKSDVVTRSEKMHTLMNKAFEALEKEIEDDLKGFDIISTNDAFKNAYDELLTFYREPIKLERINKKKLQKGEVFASYSHNVYSKEDGKETHRVAKTSMPIVLKYEGDLDNDGIEKIRKLAYAISMTTVGFKKAKVFHEHEIDQKIIEDFKNEKAEEARKSGKPEAAISKIVDGQLKKFLSENLIMHLPMMITEGIDWLSGGEELTVEDAIKQTEKKLNCKISVSFYKFLSDK
jgi:elongation factor Ts